MDLWGFPKRALLNWTHYKRILCEQVLGTTWGQGVSSIQLDLTPKLLNPTMANIVTLHLHMHSHMHLHRWQAWRDPWWDPVGEFIKHLEWRDSTFLIWKFSAWGPSVFYLPDEMHALRAVVAMVWVGLMLWRQVGDEGRPTPPTISLRPSSETLASRLAGISFTEAIRWRLQRRCTCGLSLRIALQELCTRLDQSNIAGRYAFPNYYSEFSQATDQTAINPVISRTSFIWLETLSVFGAPCTMLRNTVRLKCFILKKKRNIRFLKRIFHFYIIDPLVY